MLRSATSATRRTDSTSAAVSTVATLADSAGSSDLVLRELAVEQPRRGAPAAALETDQTLAVGCSGQREGDLVGAASAFAVSDKVRAGTSAMADSPACSGVQARSRTASR